MLLLKILKWVLILIASAVVLAILVGQVGLLRGDAPTDFGVRDGKLKGLSATANSVSSQAPLYPDHPQRRYADIAPLALRGGGGEATLAKLKTVVETMHGTQIIKSEPGYLYVQYQTRLMHYVDDVEFWFDPSAQVIQVRSASRLGKGDMGANRQRIEAVRTALAAAP
jgi:uncharacterized protein (DUF1499 family)